MTVRQQKRMECETSPQLVSVKLVLERDRGSLEEALAGMYDHEVYNDLQPSSN
jgi:hypothetical protein